MVVPSVYGYLVFICKVYRHNYTLVIKLSVYMVAPSVCGHSPWICMVSSVYDMVTSVYDMVSSVNGHIA